MTLHVAYDSRDAQASQLRGWGRYSSELLAALKTQPEVEISEYAGGGSLPELVWEQATFPILLRRDKPDLVHTPNCFLPLQRACPGVVTVHDLAFEHFPNDFASKTGWKYRTFTRKAVLSAEATICVSQATADDVCERYGVDPSRVHVVPNAPSLPQFSCGSVATEQPEPYLLAVGDIRAKKNLKRLVEAWRLSGLQQRLVLVGVGESPELEAAGAELTGFVSDEALDRLICDADAVVYPSLFEGFGLVVIEAMLRGVPVACSSIPSLRETAGGAAVLFDPLDIENIAAGLHEVLRRSSELSKLGKRRAAQFSWDRSAAETVAVYRAVCS